MSKRFSCLAFLAVVTIPLSLAAQAPSLAIQVDHPTAKVSPMLYGLMTEEINFSYDGGLYAELVRDRTIGEGWRGVPPPAPVGGGNFVVFGFVGVQDAHR